MHLRRRLPTLERLEDRSMLAVLYADVNNPLADVEGDNIYREIHEAVDAAVPGDVVKVRAGIYAPFVVATNDITVQEATRRSDPVIDVVQKPRPNISSYTLGVRVVARGVTVKGLTVHNSDGNPNTSGSVGFVVSGIENRLVGNSSVGSSRGFVVSGRGNEFIGNTSTDASLMGFHLMSSTGNTLTGNKALGSFINFDLFAGINNTLRYNVAEDGSVGFFLRGGAEGNTLVRNFASGNDIGFVTGRLSLGNMFVRNVARGNMFGFYMDSASLGNVFVGNVARGNGVGFDVRGSGNYLQRNWAVGNDDDGFSISGDDNTLTSNWSLRNGENGFAITGNNNEVQHNRSWLNKGWGFLVDAVMDNEFQGNHSLFNGLGSSNQPGIFQ